MMIPTWSQTAGEAPTHALLTPATLSVYSAGRWDFGTTFREQNEPREGLVVKIPSGGLPLDDLC